MSQTQAVGTADNQAAFSFEFVGKNTVGDDEYWKDRHCELLAKLTGKRITDIKKMSHGELLLLADDAAHQNFLAKNTLVDISKQAAAAA